MILYNFTIRQYTNENTWYLILNSVSSGQIPSGLPHFAFPNTTTTVGNETYTFLEMCEKLGSGIIFLPVIAVLANVAIAKSFGKVST